MTFFQWLDFALRVLGASDVIFVGFFLTACVWYLWHSFRLSLSFMSEKEKKKLLKKTMRGDWDD